MVSDRKLRPLPGRIAAASARRHEVVETAAQLRHESIHGKQIFSGYCTKRNNYFRLDRRDLAHQKWRAGLALVAFRSAIPRRTAFDYVRDVDILALKAHCFDHVVEQLSGAPNEGFALHIFICSRAFAHEHQFGARIAYAKDNLLASLGVKFAAGTVKPRCPLGIQSGYARRRVRQMPRYLVVRTFEVDQAAMPDVGRRSIAIANEEFPEIIWEHSHVIVDEGTVRQFCVYGAPDPETLSDGSAKFWIKGK